MSKRAPSWPGRSSSRALTSRILTEAVLLVVIAVSSSRAQSPTEVRQAFRDIHDDRVPANCLRATSWLFQNREKLKEDLLDELYKTDKQGRDAILHVLFNTSSFVPDARFAHLVVARLPEQDTKVHNFSIFDPERDRGDLPVIHTMGAHWEAWPFIDRHFSLFEPLLKEQITHTNNVFVLWATAWLWKKRGVLKEHSAEFTPAILDTVAVNLRNDQQNYNGSHAVRLFLLLGDQSLPALRKAASSTDSQSRYLAQATIDALTSGSHNAFGYLCAKVKLTGVPFGEEPEEPPWLSDAMAKYLDQDTYP